MQTLKTLLKHVTPTALLVAFLLTGSVVAQPSQAQDIDQEVLTQYSLFSENFKNEAYQSALPYWRWLYKNQPTFIGVPEGSGWKKGDRTINRGIEIYEKLAEKATEPVMKRAYLDTALTLLREAPKVLKANAVEVDDYEWNLRIGRWIHNNIQELAGLDNEVYEAYKRAYEMDPLRTDDYYVQYVIQVMVPQDDKESTVSYIEKAIETYEPVDERAALVQYLEQQLNSLFKTPEERMIFLEGQHVKYPDDQEVAQELFEIYLRLEQRDKMAVMAETLLKMEPSAQLYRRLGQYYQEEAELAKAMEYYQKAVQMATENNVKRDIYFNMASIKREQGSLGEAVRFLNNALDLDPNFGRALVERTVIQAESLRPYLSSEDIKTRRTAMAGYWVVIDNLQRAKGLDPTIGGYVDQLIRNYSQATPGAEDKFYMGWNNGDTVTVNLGMVSGSTRVR